MVQWYSVGEAWNHKHKNVTFKLKGLLLVRSNTYSSQTLLPRLWTDNLQCTDASNQTRNNEIFQKRQQLQRLYIALCDAPVVSTVILVEQRSMMSHWISGTPVKIERTSVWKTWSIGSELKLWSLKVCCSASSHLRASLFLFSILFSIIWFVYVKAFFPYGSLPQVGSLRVSSCPATWSISSCHSCLWSTAMSSSVRGTPMQHAVWRRMKLRWMRWPRQCCMSPKRKDCSQPRDASPYPSGSTSFSRRRRGGQRDLEEVWDCFTSPSAYRATERIHLLCSALRTPPHTQTHRYNTCLSRPLGEGQAAGQIW